MALAILLLSFQVGGFLAYVAAYVTVSVCLWASRKGGEDRSEASELALSLSLSAFILALGSLLVTPITCIASFGAQAVTSAARYPRTITIVVALAVASLILTEFHRTLIYSADYLYNASYEPVVLPFLHVLNVLRLLGALFVGLSNSLAHLLSVPAQSLLETAGDCLDTDGRGDVFGVVYHASQGVGMFFGAFLPLLTDITRTIDLRPAVAEFQLSGQGVNEVCDAKAFAFT